MKTISAKLGNMRKSVEWVVYPAAREESAHRGTGAKSIKIQSDHRICLFDPETGKGILSKHVANYPGFLMLHASMGATVVEVPADVIKAAIDATPKSGDEIGPGVRFA